jgi:hypothetical protein
MTVAAETTAVAQNQTLIVLVGSMVVPVPTSVMVLILVAPLSQIMDAPDQITVDHPWGQTMIVPIVNDLKGATDQAAAASEDQKDTAAAAVNMAVVDLLHGAVAATTRAADVKVIGAAAGKTSATNAVAMAIR